MIIMKERGRPSLGTQMGRQNQRGRWKSSCRDRNKIFLNSSVRVDFKFDILGCASDVDSLIDSGAKCTGSRIMRKRRDVNQPDEKTIAKKTTVYEEILSYSWEKEEGLYEPFKEDARCTTAFKSKEHVISPIKYRLR